MNLKELIIEYPQALSGDICDRLIREFEKSDDKIEGTSAAGYNPEIKDSTDLSISHFTHIPIWDELDSQIHEIFSPYVSKYVEHINSKLGYKFYTNMVIDSGYQIQRTISNGHYTWHTDDATVCLMDTATNEMDIGLETRFATYIFYLNDQKDNFEGGTTDFLFGDTIHSIIPERGKLLFFPANELYVHRGSVVTSGKKYLMTGWLSNTRSGKFEYSGMYSKQVCDAQIKKGKIPLSMKLL